MPTWPCSAMTSPGCLLVHRFQHGFGVRYAENRLLPHSLAPMGEKSDPNHLLNVKHKDYFSFEQCTHFKAKTIGYNIILKYLLQDTWLRFKHVQFYFETKRLAFVFLVCTTRIRSIRITEVNLLHVNKCVQIYNLY